VVRVLEWSVAARQQFDNWIDYLVDQDGRIAKVATEQVEARVDRLVERPFDCRRSRWHGFRELSLLRWNKIVVYDVTDVEVLIVAFYDSRQDLSVVLPTRE
jgi:plasmid stabilization system protein ParE